ncbi:hypothetical protein MRS44_012774 [Fusarium solani]|uniref:uncharacterized protein n=1 Tax=Fusarium solani TaxID=169388 RepID=UPI0032C4A79A|nr:hypothetical protein MRS44_012774 [Fusarium solani]
MSKHSAAQGCELLRDIRRHGSDPHILAIGSGLDLKRGSVTLNLGQVSRVSLAMAFPRKELVVAQAFAGPVALSYPQEMGANGRKACCNGGVAFEMGA